MEKTQEMLDRAEGKDLCNNDMCSIMYDMREFDELFGNSKLCFDLVGTPDGESFILCTMFVKFDLDWSCGFSVVVDRNADYCFDERKDFVDYMVYAYNKAEQLEQFFINKKVVKGENSTK